MTFLHEKQKVGNSLDRLVSEALDAALWSLSEPVAKTLFWHLQSRGFSFDKSRPIDLEGLDRGLKQILGIGENRVMAELYKKLSLSCKMGDVLHIDSLPTKSNYEKVCKLLETMRKEVE